MKKFPNLIFLDTEATGISQEDRLFQVAYSKGGEYFSELFIPPIPISIEAQETTHYTNEMLEDKDPFCGSSTKNNLESIFSDKKNIFVAHNAKFDIEMLNKEGVLVNDFIDTYKVSQVLDSESKLGAYRLQYLRYALRLKIKDEENIVAHDALGDVKVLEALFVRLFEKIREDSSDDEEALKRMIDISSNPIEIKKFSFGKYKDQLVEDVAKKDRGYLQWLLDQKKQQETEGQKDEDWIYTLEKFF